MKRRSKTIAQQCRYYEVDNIFEYMVSVYLNVQCRTTIHHIFLLYKFHSFGAS